MASHPLFCPVYLPGQEPLPPGTTDADRAQIKQMAEWSKIMTGAMESCAFKCAFSGVAGFGLGGFFSLLSASFAVDDPLRRSNLQAAAMARNPNMPAPPEMTTMQTTKEFFRETGRSMYRSGKGFGKVGALYAGIECCIEAVSRCPDRLPTAGGRHLFQQISLTSASPSPLSSRDSFGPSMTSQILWQQVSPLALFWPGILALRESLEAVLPLQPSLEPSTGTSTKSRHQSRRGYTKTNRTDKRYYTLPGKLQSSSSSQPRPFVTTAPPPNVHLSFSVYSVPAQIKPPLPCPHRHRPLRQQRKAL